MAGNCNCNTPRASDEGILDKCPVIAVLSVKALTREDLLLSSGNREANYFFSTLSFLPRVSELF